MLERTTGAIIFDDGPAYERFMGRWSRAAGSIFLDWAAPPLNGRWLEVGCGTGAFTGLALDRCMPAAMAAIDPAPEQIRYAARRCGERAHFGVADARILPFADGIFDVVASALVINFIAEPDRAIREMRRVAHAGATVAGYVWDFANGLTPNSPVIAALRHVGLHPPPVPGTEHSSREALQTLFHRAGFEDIHTTSIGITVSFSDFEHFWQAQLPSFSPLTRIIGALNQRQRAKVATFLRAEVPAASDGSIAYGARANAVKASVHC